MGKNAGNGFLKQYFWEIDFKKFRPLSRPYYVISRLLEYGDEKALRWLFDNFTTRQMKNTLRKMRGFSERSANFWAIYFGMKREEVKCLSRQFRKIHKNFWPY
ncbi:MAG: hypothetical protein ABIH68_00665 [bacterium]